MFTIQMCINCYKSQKYTLFDPESLFFAVYDKIRWQVLGQSCDTDTISLKRWRNVCALKAGICDWIANIGLFRVGLSVCVSTVLFKIANWSGFLDECIRTHFERRAMFSKKCGHIGELVHSGLRNVSKPVMHSSRMRTARLLTVSLLGGASILEGYIQGGAPLGLNPEGVHPGCNPWQQNDTLLWKHYPPNT